MPARAPRTTLVLTCEHGGNRIPRAFRHLFVTANPALQSHRGWDVGALQAARALRQRLGAPLFAATVSRLLVDLNRSAGHPKVFSEFTRDLPAPARQALLAAFHAPHRATVEAAIRAASAPVLHFAVHSFTPVLDGVVRQTDVALLYDPQRPRERAFCQAFAALWRPLSPLRLRFNYPYKGTSDGLTTALRRRYADRRYAGIELEINQRLVSGDAARWRGLLRDVGTCLLRCLEQ